MPTTWVRFGDHRDYPIVIRAGVLRELGPLARQRVSSTTACLISHPRVYRHYGRSAERSLADAGFRVHPVLVPEGETTKCLRTAESVIGVMLKKRLDRGGCVVALGGGVVGDLAGFVAATYMRGVDFIQVPTTLLAQVDSSVGGKVAVNHALGKNTIGAFHQPRLVVSDPEVLRTLADRQFRSGLAEMIKAAIIADEKFFAWLERTLPSLQAKDPATLARAIERACAIKARVVAADEKEHGLRAVLNYGHTLGHALEAYHHYRGYLHGEAVAIGMAAAARMCREAGWCGEATVARQLKLLQAAGLPVRGRGEDAKKLLELMKNDKKARKGRTNFVLTPTIGHARLCFNLTSFSVRRVVRSVV